MKPVKNLLSIFISFSVLVSAFAFDEKSIKHHALENGLEVYFLEDESSPIIRMELDVKAGFSRQTEKNAGYFSLYANLKGAEAGEDVVKFVKTVSPDEVEKSVLELSEVMRPVHLSDSELKSKLEESKSALNKYYAQPAGFINSAIDSKIFPEFPWKRSSGAVPSLFNSKKISESRAILDSVANNYYVPSNSVFFISGNITENTALEIIEKYFGNYKNQNLLKSDETKSGQKSQKNEEKSPSSKKFVIHDKSFSNEMTQICVQYKNFDKNQAEILAEIWNDNESVFKKTLLKQKNLKILGAEYIDASSAQDTLASRLIIQSLLGVVKVNPVIQADLFLSKSRENEEITDEMIQNATKKREEKNLRIYENSTDLMSSLASFVETCPEDDKIRAFFHQNDELSKITAENLNESVKNEEPFVFVLVNSGVYKKNAKEFKNAGYQVLTSKNSVWFNQNEYKNLFESENQNQKKSDKKKKSSVQEDILNSADRFIKKSSSQITTLALQNEIPVILKKNENTSQVQVSLIISGGDLLFADKTPGLAAVISGSIAENIRKQLDLFVKNGAISEDSYKNSYSIQSKTFSSYSEIDLTLPSSDLNFAFQAMYTALIFCDIAPATADMETYRERTRWKLKSGTMEFQLLCDAIRILYDGTNYPNLFDDEKNKPDEIDYSKILAAYPSFLDASRFSFVVSGGFSDQGKLLSYMNETFGTLETHQKNQISKTQIANPNITETEKKFPLRHLFLTDIPKEKAGPMPAVLIPTTKFLDPALFCFSTPDLSTPDISLYNALFLEIGKKMNEKAKQAGEQSKVQVYLPEIDVPFARIIVTNIEHTAGAEKIYAESVEELKNELKAQLDLRTENVKDLEKNELLARLENNWIMEVIADAGTNEGTSELVKRGFVLGNPKLYLEQYNAVDKAKLEDYFLILESSFPDKPPMRLYSKDSKK